MAEGIVLTQTVKTVVGINLTLSIEEAKTLRVILDGIGGSPYNSARKYSNSINRGLDCLADIDVVDEEYFQTKPGQSSIYFKDFPKNA